MMMKHVNWPVVAPFTIGCLIGSSVGGLTFVQVPAWFIQLGIGICLIWTMFGRPPKIDGKKVFATGIVSSLLINFFGSTANFIAAIVKAMNLTPPGHVSTHAALMEIQHVLKHIIFGLLGFAFEPYLPLLLLMILGVLAGTFVGKQAADAGRRPILQAGSKRDSGGSRRAPDLDGRQRTDSRDIGRGGSGSRGRAQALPTFRSLHKIKLHFT